LFLGLCRILRLAPHRTLVLPPAAEHCDGVQKTPVIGEPAAVLVEEAIDLAGFQEARVSCS
jgi:hypothetical protein